MRCSAMTSAFGRGIVSALLVCGVLLQVLLKQGHRTEALPLAVAVARADAKLGLRAINLVRNLPSVWPTVISVAWSTLVCVCVCVCRAVQLLLDCAGKQPDAAVGYLELISRLGLTPGTTADGC